MKKNVTTKETFPWAVQPEDVERTMYEHEKDQQEEQDRLFRGAQLYRSRRGKSLSEELRGVAASIREGEATLECNVIFCAGTCEEAAEYVSFVADFQQRDDLKKEKQKIADLCRAKAPKDPQALLGELDYAMDQVLSGKGDPYLIAESIGAAEDFLSQVVLGKRLPAEEEPFELPAVLRDVAEILECGDEVHPQNRGIILEAVKDTLEYLGAESPMSINGEDYSFVESGADLHALHYAKGAVLELETPENEDQIALILGLLEQVSESVKEE